MAAKQLITAEQWVFPPKMAIIKGPRGNNQQHTSIDKQLGFISFICSSAPEKRPLLQCNYYRLRSHLLDPSGMT